MYDVYPVYVFEHDTRQMLTVLWGEPEAYHHAVVKHKCL